MFQKLASHNEDIQRLVEKGYALAFDSGYLIVRDIPYLDNERRLQIGAIVAKVDFINETRVVPTDHQIYFAGTFPHGLDERPIPNLGGGPTQLPLSDVSKDIVVQRSFSNKPRSTGRFADHFEKFESYISIISGPAIELHGASPLTFRVMGNGHAESVFKFQDTLTSRAEITDLTQKFKNDIVAIVGLGGTGAYLLDFLVKTPVKEIRGFDLDEYRVHNAYRSPGKLDAAELGLKKSVVYRARYENFRHGLSFKEQHVDSTCHADFEGVTFAFVCVDKGPSRAEIFDLLISKGIPFIDVGMGLKRKNDALTGMMRCTYFPPELAPKICEKGWVDTQSNPNDLYRTNIQIGELNALNACLALIRFKQIRGFYAQEVSNLNLLFDVADLKTVGESELP